MRIKCGVCGLFFGLKSVIDVDWGLEIDVSGRNLLLALEFLDLVSFPALALVCAVLLQVLEFGRGRGVGDFSAGSVCSL